MIVPETDRVKNIFEELKAGKKLISQWHMPYGGLITRLSAAEFFFTPTDPSLIPEIEKELSAVEGLRITENSYKKLSPLQYRAVFRNEDEAELPDRDFVDIYGTEKISLSDRQKIIYEFNESELIAEPETESIVELFDAVASDCPEKTALVSDGKSISYSVIKERSEKTALYILSKQVFPGDIVALSPKSYLEAVYGILGILRAGCTYLILDPDLPDIRKKKIIEDSSAKFVITGEENQDCSGPEKMQNERCYHKNACIVYTSGSTGEPKGVLLTQRGILNRLRWGWMCFPYEKDDVCILITPLSFVDHCAEIFSPLLKKTPSVVAPEQGKDNGVLSDLVNENKVTRITLVPTRLRKILGINEEKLKNLRSLRYVFSSGEHLPAETIYAFKNILPESSLINIYGSSEVSADVTWHGVIIGKNNSSIKYFYSSPVYDKIMESVNFRKSGNYTSGNVDFTSLLKSFSDTRLPAFPSSVEDYYETLGKDILPYTIDTASPYFTGHMTSTLPLYLHEMSLFISMLNQNLVKLETSKSLTAIEKQTLGMLHRKIFRKPSSFYQETFTDPDLNYGVFTSCGTVANITSLLAARNSGVFKNEECGGSVYRALCAKGYRDAVIIGSELMHYSMNKAASVLGFAKDSIAYVKSDPDGGIDIDILEKTIIECREKKLFIIALVGIAGATETGQADPLEKMAEVAQKYGIHFHIDAAWGGPIVFSDKYSHLLGGIENADSVTICGHKQFYLPQGVSMCLFRDPSILKYIQVTARYQSQPGSFDTGRFSIEGSRAATSLLLHSALHIFGKYGLEYLINTGIEKAQAFASIIKTLRAFELIVEPVMNIVNYRYIPAGYRQDIKRGIVSEEANRKINEINDQIQKEQFRIGKTFVSKTVLYNTRYGSGTEIVVFRVVISNPLTGLEHLIANLNDQILIAADLLNDRSDVDTFGLEKQNELISGIKQTDHDCSVIGKPVINTKVFIVNGRMELNPIGVPGELIVSGKNLAEGYLNRPLLTAERFVWWDPSDCRVYYWYNKPEGAIRVYRTGDICKRLPDGSIEFAGRADDQIKIAGDRIEPGAIEAEILRLKGVTSCMVRGEKNIFGETELAAYIVSESHSDGSEIRKELAERISENMIPKFIRFVKELPLTASGKINRKSL